jgi:uncharacterized protein (DUF885 family)
MRRAPPLDHVRGAFAAGKRHHEVGPALVEGQLSWELFRARRLVVDTGLHAKHWTRQQAIDSGIEAAEVERYVVWPGQATSYMIGELKILELRDKRKRRDGSGQLVIGPKNCGLI